MPIWKRARAAFARMNRKRARKIFWHKITTWRQKLNYSAQKPTDLKVKLSFSDFIWMLISLVIIFDNPAMRFSKNSKFSNEMVFFFQKKSLATSSQYIKLTEFLAGIIDFSLILLWILCLWFSRVYVGLWQLFLVLFWLEVVFWGLKRSIEIRAHFILTNMTLATNYAKKK